MFEQHQTKNVENRAMLAIEGLGKLLELARALVVALTKALV